jgi:mono/diheme cytochrome c family protein
MEIVRMMMTLWNRLESSWRLMVVGVLLAVQCLSVRGAVDSSSGDDILANEVLPVIADRCLQCHGAKRQKGGLRLDSKQAATIGGESGLIWHPGRADESEIVRRIESDDLELRMPPKGEALSTKQINAIVRWIDEGARWPDEFANDFEAAVEPFWSLKPLVLPIVPAITNEQAEKTRNPIDAFVVQRLADVGLDPSPEASRQVLIRRIYFDLLGLPPSPEEIERFIHDPDPRAYHRLVDELLASPQYGERWARHWLDLVHFGETHGYDKDKPRPNAWPYRDYVIRALNDDRPYHRFVQEQLAGDVLFPGTLDGLAATGFISAGPWDFIGHAEVPETKIDGRVARNLDRDDMVTATMNAFTSLTVQCARCHDHKFDPVSMKDYYGLQSVFAALDRSDASFDKDPSVRQKRAELSEQVGGLEKQRDGHRAQIKELGGKELAELDQQIRDLDKTSEPHPSFGYHSGIESDAGVEKWVQIDLGELVVADRIEYMPAHDDYNGIGAGFGFPIRYRIEVSDRERFEEGSVTVANYMDEDVTNPAGNRQRVLLNGKPIRFVRLTAMKLAPRSDDFIFALAEMTVLDDKGVNLARSKSVTALDSIESGARWSKKNLVDGIFPGVKRQSKETVSELVVLRDKRRTMYNERVPSIKRDALAESERQLGRLEKQLTTLPAPVKLYIGRVHSGQGAFRGRGHDGGRPREIRVLGRGDITSPREVVGPGAVSVYNGGDAYFRLQEGHKESDRRVALSKWILDEANPLTWRSIVNRLWQHHFGRGIVDSPNDFGRMGQRPTHPELLDWLAMQFRDGGQSVKSIHRLILTSATYRQSSTTREEAMKIDGGNRFLWRMNRRRLDAESIRDSVLSLAGSMNLEMYGPSFQDFVVEKPEHSPHYQYHLHDPLDVRSHRRSVYRFLVRSQQQPFMTTLDCADPSMMVDKRSETLTPLQALSLLNNQFMTAMANRMGEGISADEAGRESDLARLFYRVTGREILDDELSLLVAYSKQYGNSNACRVMLNLNEFVFVD